MNQCVPSWELDDTPTPPKLPLQNQSNSLAPDVPTLDYEVAELTWENGQLAMHGLGPPRVPNNKPTSNYGGTLESIVNQGTRSIPQHHPKSALAGSGHGGNEVVPWFNCHHVVADTPLVPGSLTMAKDALVPCSAKSNYHCRPPSSVQVPGLDGSTHVGSCSGGATNSRDWMAAPPVGMKPTHEWSSRADMSVSGSATCAGDSRQLTVDTYDREMGTRIYTSTSMGSPENTSSDKQCTNRTGDDHDSVCHSRSKREVGDEEDEKKGSKNSSSSTKRKRAAAIHNQSERKRRDKINQRMKTLQKMVPNSSKTDKASMLDEVIEYLKQLQSQVNMMSRMNMSPAMMLPLAMQQQLQMSMLTAPMGMGMSMGMGMGMGMGAAGVMDINTLSRPNITGLPPFLHPTAAAAAAAFMQPMTSWDGSTDRLNAAAAASAVPDPLAALLACQSQPMTMDAYSRMAALYQQFQQPAAGSGPKS